MAGLLPIKTMSQRAKKDWPVPESPLIGRHFQHFGGHQLGRYVITRVHGNKTERNRTPENCPTDKVTGEPRLWDFTLSVTAAEVSPEGELGKLSHHYIYLAEIEGAPDATQD